MKTVFHFFKDSLLCLLLFWCPWGRDSRARYRHFLLFSVFAAFGLVFFNARAQVRPELLPWANIGLLWGILSLYMAAVRRGHDLGYSGWYTLTHFWRFSQYPYRVLGGEEGEIHPNQYGRPPANG